jgi:hypothetical protein
MTETRREQTFGIFVCGFALLFFTLYIAGHSIELLARGVQANLWQSGIAESGYHAVVAWSLFGAFAVWGQYSRGRFPHVWANYGRLFYTWAALLCVLHVTVAFHVGHAWSHTKAYEHVETISGFGPGIYVNYGFAAVWLADVVWAWVALDHYLNRSRWLSWSLLVFMAFIVFNAAVVFGTGNRRIVSGVLFLIPLYAIWATRPWAAPRMKTNEPGPVPGSEHAPQSTDSHSPT